MSQKDTEFNSDMQVRFNTDTRTTFNMTDELDKQLFRNGESKVISRQSQLRLSVP